MSEVMWFFIWNMHFDSDIRSFAEGSKKLVTIGMDAAGVLSICLTGRDGTSIH
ncbi:MAG: hypothetical protein J6J44_03065 [Lachnospiraceae bacterium]|nr:hypothetical protein [Lachnospiraceae bacterium]